MKSINNIGTILKMNKSIRIFLILLLLLSFKFVLSQNIEKQLRDLYEKKIEYKKEIYNKIQKFVNNNPNSEGLATLYFYLAELSTEINVEKPAITAKYYQEVIKHDPMFIRQDVARYNIGYYGFQKELDERNQARLNNIDLVINWPDSLRLTEKELDYAIYALKEIVVRHPDSDYYFRSAYRLGVIYFEIALDSREPKKYFDKSAKYFDIVAQSEDSSLKYLGMFQKAWVYFASAQFEKAIDEFSHILTLIKSGEIEEGETFFEADAIENIAFSLIEYDGTDYEQYSIAAQKAKEIFKDFVSVEYGKQILLESVKLKKKYNAPMQATDLLKNYLLCSCIHQ